MHIFRSDPDYDAVTFEQVEKAAMKARSVNVHAIHTQIAGSRLRAVGVVVRRMESEAPTRWRRLVRRVEKKRDEEATACEPTDEVQRMREIWREAS